jgi:hypothetical protein
MESSAEGAEYKSQGQARSASPLVFMQYAPSGLKGRNISPLWGWCVLILYQGRRASRLPLAFIFRAFGAGFRISRLWRWLSYFAPLALAFVFRAFGAGFHISRLWRWLSYFAPLALQKLNFATNCTLREVLAVLPRI